MFDCQDPWICRCSRPEAVIFRSLPSQLGGNVFIFVLSSLFFCSFSLSTVFVNPQATLQLIQQIHTFLKMI